METRKMAFADIIVVCTYQLDFVSPRVDLVLRSHLTPSWAMTQNCTSPSSIHHLNVSCLNSKPHYVLGAGGGDLSCSQAFCSWLTWQYVQTARVYTKEETSLLVQHSWKCHYWDRQKSAVPGGRAISSAPEPTVMVVLTLTCERTLTGVHSRTLFSPWSSTTTKMETSVMNTGMGRRRIWGVTTVFREHWQVCFYLTTPVARAICLS